MLYIELNIGKGISEKVLLYEHEDPKHIVQLISNKHGRKTLLL